MSTAPETDLSHYFDHYSGFRAVPDDISDWDTSAVTNMSAMFYLNQGFNEDIGGWDISNIDDMSHMFSGASAFDQDLGWCVGDGVYLGNAFTGTVCAISSCGIADFICQP